MKFVSAPMILLLAANLSGCNKFVKYGEKKAQEKPSEPATPPFVADVEPETNPPIVPDTKLNLTISRVNSLSWWKVCLEAWVTEFPNSRKSVGCNTDDNLTKQTIAIEGSTQQCNTVALSFAVYKNKEPCSTDSRSCSHFDEPAHIRSTANPNDLKFLKAAPLFGLSYPFKDENLKPIVIPAESQPEYASFSNLKTAASESRFRVFFEDQTEASFTAWQAGGDAAINGIDYFDYVIELQSAQAPIGLEGSTSITCGQSSTNKPPEQTTKDP